MMRFMVPVLSLGARCRFRREQLGLKRARVGSLAGLQASHYERVEDDAVTPGLEAVAKIARALDCAAGWIAFGEGEAPAPPEAAA